MKKIWLAAVALVTALFASCSDLGSSGSATFTLNAKALASKSVSSGVIVTDSKESHTYTVVVPYTYDGHTQEARKNFQLTTHTWYDEETEAYKSEVLGAEDLSMTIENLPLGKEVTFEMKIYDSYEHEKYEGQGFVEEITPVPFLVSKAPVTAIITDSTPVTLALEWYEDTEEGDATQTEKTDEENVAESDTTAEPLFTVPTADTNFDASTDAGFAQLLTAVNNGIASGSEAYVGKIVKITLKNDITYTSTSEFIYNAADDASALIIDLNGHTLTIAGTISPTSSSVFTAETTMYVGNGTIEDTRSDSNSDSNIFYNKSTLYLKDVSIKGGTHKAVYHNANIDAAAVLYVQGGTFSGFSGTATAPIWLDKGYVVISGTTFEQNGSAQAAIVNKGCVILTGNTIIQSGATGLDNSGTAVLLGTTIGTGINNTGTFALLTAYEHTTGSTTETFTAADANMITDTVTLSRSGIIVLGKRATVSKIALGSTEKIYVATDSFDYPTVATIIPSAYDKTFTTPAGNYADVFGKVADIKNNENIDAFVRESVVEATSTTANAFKVESGGSIAEIDSWFYAKQGN